MGLESCRHNRVDFEVTIWLGKMEEKEPRRNGYTVHPGRKNIAKIGYTVHPP
jgi:hypothetical protein